MEDKYKAFLSDLGTLLSEYAQEAIQSNQQSKPQDKDFNSGYMMGFHRVITLMQSQADAFDIKQSEINIDKVNEADFFA